jgi:signal transduction histidine kinase
MTAVDELEEILGGHTSSDVLENDAFSMLEEFDKELDSLDAEIDAEDEDKIGDWQYVTELLRIFRMLNSSLRLETVLEQVMDAAIAVTQAERGFIVFRNEKGEFELKIARDAFKNTLTKSEFRVSNSLLEQAIELRQIVYMDDVLSADDYIPSNSVAQLKLRCFVCSPLIIENNVIGAIYTDSNKPLIGQSRKKKQLFTMFADQAALAIRNSQLYQNLHNSYEQLTQAQDRLIFTERMATRGKIAARIGHEMNNLLTGTQGNLELALRFMKEGESQEVVEKKILSVIGLCQRMTRFTNGLMSNVHTSSKLELWQLNYIVKDFLDFIQPLFKKSGASLLVDIDDNLPDLYVDSGQIQQVLYNLATNAVEERADATVTIRTSYLQDEGNVELSVADNGPGISKSNLNRIFEPLYTGKKDGHGFGLSVCKEIVKRHGGTMNVESEEGQGARFIIKLPVVKKSDNLHSA